MLCFSKEWEIEPPPIHTDHQLISVRLSKQSMPFIGKGQWTLNPTLLCDTQVKNGITKEAIKLCTSLDRCEIDRTEQDNSQTAFKSFKTKVIAILRNRAKRMILMARL